MRDNPLTTWIRSDSITLSSLFLAISNVNFKYAATNPQLRRYWHELRAARAVADAITTITKSGREPSWVTTVDAPLLDAALVEVERVAYAELKDVATRAPEYNSEHNIAAIRDVLVALIAAELQVLADHMRKASI